MNPHARSLARSLLAAALLLAAAAWAGNPAHRLPGESPSFAVLTSEPEPPSAAETFVLRGDLAVLGGRWRAAAAAYRRAEAISPETPSRCGRLHQGRLYGVENVLKRRTGQGSRGYRFTGYLLAWDPDSGRVLERHLLPEPPSTFRVTGGILEFTFESHPTVHLVEHRLEPRVWETASWTERIFRHIHAEPLMMNFIHRLWRELPDPPWSARPDLDERLPTTLPRLEAALRREVERDPTDPWHPFYLGQVLWAEGHPYPAEALWQGMWAEVEAGGYPAIPYSELLWMAALHEVYGQPRWGDRGYRQALKRRRSLPRHIEFDLTGERTFGVPVTWLRGVLRQRPERLAVWWRREREIFGVAPADAFWTALWAEELERRGDREGAAEERLQLRRARGWGLDPWTRSAWVDYAGYLTLAAAAALVAHLAVLAAALLKRLPRGLPQGLRQRLRADRRRPYPRWLGHGVRTGVLLLVLALTSALTVLAATYLVYLARVGATGEVSVHHDGELLRAWLADGLSRGFLEPWRSPGGDVGVDLAGLLSVTVETVSPPALAAALAAALLAIGFLVSRPRIAALVERSIPGAALVRRGSWLREVS